MNFKFYFAQITSDIFYSADKKAAKVTGKDESK